ncbi:hypothetical protein [Halococcus sp. PRR34]|uniref:hypothetical protein n=1 Tax=Halococcus sp. PRR34 TaxID=3020830 RepID=UPI0023600D9E|nr:hypothetical protein [Halococcus sp. PRR34]
MGHEKIAYVYEPSYNSAPGTDPTYLTPGADVTPENITVENAAQRIRVPGQADPYEVIYNNFEGQMSISGTMTAGNLDWLRAVTGASTSPYAFQIGQPASTRWYISCDPARGTAERELMGAVIPQASITIEQDNEITFDLTVLYGDESFNSTLTNGSVIQPTGDTLVFHGAEVSIPTSTTKRLPQSVTLQLNSQARLLRGFSRHPAAAQMGAHESQVEFGAIYDKETGNTSLAYGDSSATAPTTSPNAASAEVTIADSGGSNVVTASLGGIGADSYDWQNAGNPNEDMLENGTFFVSSPSIAVNTA